MENIQIFLLISIIILVLIYFTNKNENFVLNSLQKSSNISYIDGNCDQCSVTDSKTLTDPSKNLIVNCPVNCPKKNSCMLQGFEGTLCSK